MRLPWGIYSLQDLSELLSSTVVVEDDDSKKVPLALATESEAAGLELSFWGNMLVNSP